VFDELVADCQVWSVLQCVAVCCSVLLVADCQVWSVGFRSRGFDELVAECHVCTQKGLGLCLRQGVMGGGRGGGDFSFEVFSGRAADCQVCMYIYMHTLYPMRWPYLPRTFSAKEPYK